MSFPRKPSDGRPRAPLAPKTYREIVRRLRLGDLQHDIAADLGLNQGRISEVNTGKRGSEAVQSVLPF